MMAVKSGRVFVKSMDDDDRNRDSICKEDNLSKCRDKNGASVTMVVMSLINCESSYQDGRRLGVLTKSALDSSGKP